MEFARQNILDTISKGRYHSCVLTSYSFDFSFFELRVMRALRGAGVKNVLVLLDGRFLAHLASRASGREFTLAAGFSIWPIYVPHGVFHPKLTLLFGRQEGAFFVGSGNLTSAGLGNNDETWGCFHLAEPTAPTAPLFAEAWAYVQRITANAVGAAAQKLHWIREFTPWLASLPPPRPGTPHPLGAERTAALLTNDGRGILPQLLTLLDGQPVRTITSISPYYDQAGAVLRQLHEAFPQAKLSCVVEERAGTLPTKLDPAVAAATRFYQWAQCVPLRPGAPSRLHAKLLHLTTPTGEYLLLGSANATASGMGTVARPPVNEEVSLLLYRPSGNYLLDLGLKLLPAGALSFEELRKLPHPRHVGPTDEAFNLAVTGSLALMLAELEAGVLTLHLSQPPTGQYELRLVNYRGTVVFAKPTLALATVITCAVPPALTFGSVNLVELHDQNGQLAARQFVQFPAEQARFSPDPQLEKLQKAFAGVEHGGFEQFDGLWDLLQFDEPESLTPPSAGGPAPQSPPASAHRHLSYDEFNAAALPPEELLRQKSLLGNIAPRIEEFLALVSHQLALGGHAHDFRDRSEHHAEEEADSDEQPLPVDEDVLAEQVRTAAVLRACKSIDRFLTRLLRHQRRQLQAFTSASTPSQIALPTLTLNDLSGLNVALYVVLHYVGRPFTYYERGHERHAYYLSRFGKLTDYTTLKGFCHLLIGNFLLLATAGLSVYQEPTVRQRVEAGQQSILERVLFLVTQVSWSKREEVIRDLLLFNALHYLRPQASALSQLAARCEEALAALAERTLLAAPQGPARLRRFFTTYSARLAALEHTLRLAPAERPTRKASVLQPGDWIYISKLGVCAVQARKKKGAGLTLTLMRPGLQLETEDYHHIFDYSLPEATRLITV